MINISFTGTSPARYYIETDLDKPILGRRYDNESETIKIKFPANQENAICTMYFTYKGRYITTLIVTDEEIIDIPKEISQYPWIDISFTFERNDSTYLKNTEIKRFYFLDAIKPLERVGGNDND